MPIEDFVRIFYLYMIKVNLLPKFKWLGNGPTIFRFKFDPLSVQHELYSQSFQDYTQYNTSRKLFAASIQNNNSMTKFSSLFLPAK